MKIHLALSILLLASHSFATNYEGNFEITDGWGECELFSSSRYVVSVDKQAGDRLKLRFVELSDAPNSSLHDKVVTAESDGSGRFQASFDVGVSEHTSYDTRIYRGSENVEGLRFELNSTLRMLHSGMPLCEVTANFSGMPSAR